MLAKGVIALIALAVCAGCATGTGASGPAAPQGFASPVGTETPTCSSGTYYNRAAGFCVGAGGS